MRLVDRNQKVITMPASSFKPSAVTLDKTHPRLCYSLWKTPTLAVSRPLTLSSRGPDVPWDTMSNSTWLSYLAGLLLDCMPDKTAGDKEQLWGWLARCWRQTGGRENPWQGRETVNITQGKKYQKNIRLNKQKQRLNTQPKWHDL